MQTNNSKYDAAIKMIASLCIRELDEHDTTVSEVQEVVINRELIGEELGADRASQ